MVHNLAHDVAREQERSEINPPTPGLSVEPGEEHPEESLEEKYRDKGGRLNVPSQVRKKEREEWRRKS